MLFLLSSGSISFFFFVMTKIDFDSSFLGSVISIVLDGLLSNYTNLIARQYVPFLVFCFFAFLSRFLVGISKCSNSSLVIFLNVYVIKKINI